MAQEEKNWFEKLLSPTGRNQSEDPGLLELLTFGAIKPNPQINDYTQPQVPVDVSQANVIPPAGYTSPQNFIPITPYDQYTQLGQVDIIPLPEGSDIVSTATDPNLTTAAQGQKLMDYLNMINSSIDLQEQGILAGQQARYGDLLYGQALRQGMSDPSGLTAGMAEQYSDKMSAAEVAAFGMLDLETEQMLRDLESTRLMAPMQAEEMVMEDWRNLSEQIAFSTQMAEFYRDQASLIDPEVNPEGFNELIEMYDYYNNETTRLANEQSVLNQPAQTGAPNQEPQPEPEQEILPPSLDYDPGFDPGPGGFSTMEEVYTNLLDAPVLGTEALGTWQRTNIALEQAAASSATSLGNIPKEEIMFDSKLHSLLLQEYLSDTEGPVSVAVPLNSEAKAAIDQLIADGVIPEDAVTWDAEGGLKSGGFWAGAGALASGLLIGLLALAGSVTAGATSAAIPFVASTITPALMATGAAYGSAKVNIDRAVIEQLLTENTLKYSTEMASITGG